MRAGTSFAMALAGGFALVAAAIAQSQPRALQFNVVYSCSSGRTKLKVLSCAGSAETDSCEAQYVDPGAPQGAGAKIAAARKSLTELLQACVIERPPAKVESAAPAPQAPAPQTPAAQSPRQTRAPAAAATGQTRPPAPPPMQQMASNGIKVGDMVDASTGFGWISGKVLAINGNSYRIRLANGIDVTKDYPAEVRRIGAPTSQDRANGIYQLHDRVQVLFEGRWVDSEIVTTMGMDYQVKLPGNRVAWTNGQNLRPAAAAPPPAQAAKPAGAPCGAKLEGRWSSDNAQWTVEFRSGKAHMTMLLMDPETVDCFMSGDKILLRKPGSSEEMVFTLNDDGTIDARFAVLKKKGK